MLRTGGKREFEVGEMMSQDSIFTEARWGLTWEVRVGVMCYRKSSWGDQVLGFHADSHVGLELAPGLQLWPPSSP